MSNHQPMIPGFTAGSHFKATSAFANDAHPAYGDALSRYTDRVEAASLTSKTLYDWADRLFDAAQEAGDEGLEVLESNLRDIRDEIMESAKLLG